MSHFVLIHGAFMGAWFWEGMSARLRAHGHEVAAPDLPSQGQDATPPQGVTIDDYVATALRHVDAAPEPVVLVGHSLGGLTISLAAEARPEKVKRLVYVAAFLLPSGMSPRRLYENLGEPSPVMAHSTVHEDGTIDLNPDGLEACILTASPAAIIAEARRHFKSTPRQPMAQPLDLSDARFGRVPRVYIAATGDKAIPYRIQRHMVATLPCERVVTLECDHAPMFSAPDALENALLACA